MPRNIIILLLNFMDLEKMPTMADWPKSLGKKHKSQGLKTENMILHSAVIA